jgi:hypothetical protein
MVFPCPFLESGTLLASGTFLFTIRVLLNRFVCIALNSYLAKNSVRFG